MFDATFYTLVALIIFFIVVAYAGAPKLLTKALDDRSQRIAKDLEDAKKLREEAESLIAEYRRKAAQAQDEAQEIVNLAKAEAEAFAKEGRRKMAEMLERRTAAAEQKIAQAETQAIKDVRNAATELAVAAAAQLIAQQGDGGKLVDESIKNLASKLN